MRKLLQAMILGHFLIVPAIFAADSDFVTVSDTKFATTTKVNGTDLVLNGAGLRTKFLVKVYTLGLYVPQKSNSAKSLVQVSTPEMIEIHMLRTISADTFADALNEGLAANNSKDALAKLKPQIDQLEATMKGAGKTKENDVIRLSYIPGSGTQVLLNGTKLGDSIGGGADFYSALLKIWLGDNPIDKSLKDSIVGSSK